MTKKVTKKVKKKVIVPKNVEFKNISPEKVKAHKEVSQKRAYLNMAESLDLSEVSQVLFEELRIKSLGDKATVHNYVKLFLLEFSLIPKLAELSYRIPIYQDHILKAFYYYCLQKNYPTNGANRAHVVKALGAHKVINQNLEVRKLGVRLFACFVSPLHTLDKFLELVPEDLVCPWIHHSLSL